MVTTLLKSQIYSVVLRYRGGLYDTVYGTLHCNIDRQMEDKLREKHCKNEWET